MCFKLDMLFVFCLLFEIRCLVLWWWRMWLKWSLVDVEGVCLVWWVGELQRGLAAVIRSGSAGGIELRLFVCDVGRIEVLCVSD